MSKNIAHSPFCFTQTKSHKNLQKLFNTLKKRYDEGQPFALEQKRYNYQYMLFDSYINFSRHWLTDDVISELINLAKESPLKQSIEQFFGGEAVNLTEGRPALHTALRAQGTNALGLNNEAIHQNVASSLNLMKEFCEAIYDRKHCGYDNSPITDVVHIGIGGSHLGPQFVSEALTAFHVNKVKVHFWSAVDNYPDKENPILTNLKPQSTLFILASKSFTTKELVINAALAKKWFIEGAGEEPEKLAKHFIALTSNTQAALEMGVGSKYIFPMWDWVGGRYSVWSAIGLPVMLNVGYDNFMKLLSGASEVDEHFYNAPWEENLPILMALIGIWYINYCDANNHAVITYHSVLEQLSAYLQQLEMESNGKSVNKQGKMVNYQTSPVIWGGSGIKGQHSYHQLLHQGTVCCPIDFIGVANEPNTEEENNFLLSNLLAQSYVLHQGKVVDNSHQCLDGQRPSSIFLMKQVTPEAIGRLLALYEHKVFVQGVIWDINSFDQWGVEEGKVIAKKWQNLFDEGEAESLGLDSTTHSAVQFINSARA